MSLLPSHLILQRSLRQHTLDGPAFCCGGFLLLTSVLRNTCHQHIRRLNQDSFIAMGWCNGTCYSFTFLLMKCQGRFGKSTVYFINEGFQRGFVKTDGEEVFQKDVNGNLETAKKSSG